MKKTILYVLLLQIAFIGTNASPVVIHGKWDRPGKEVSLYRIESGRLETLSTYFLQEDKTFGFSFTTQSPGYYVIGSGQPQTRMHKYAFYFNPGDVLQVEFNTDSYILTGENTPQNKVMADWHSKIAPLENMAVYFSRTISTYVDFFPLLEEFVHEGYVPQKTGDDIFDRSINNFLQYDLMSTAVHFLFTPRPAHPDTEEYPDFYTNINLEELSKDASILEYPYGASLFSQLLFLKDRFSETGKPHTITETLAFLQNDTLKGEYLLQQALRVKTYDGYMDLMKPFQQFIVTADQKKRASELVTKLARENKAGEPAINFTNKDINGKDVSLSDFKGKVVLVDIWATWCGPCKQELPHLKKLKNEYEGKDIVFMCVSVDEAKDLQKWKDFVKNEQLEGIQVFSGGFESDIAKFYDIKTIPRFMLIDKAGNMVSKDAPRPSTKEIRLLIENELKK